MSERTKMSGKKAFTLVELLVVIAIIALLLSITLPSLKRAREIGKRAVCLSNLHQLTLSWMVYAEQNDGRIVNGNTWSKVQGNQLVPGEDGWVGWAQGALFIPVQETSQQESAFRQTIKMQLEEIRVGALYPYVENVNAYKCPVGRKGNERTYAIVDSMNGWNGHDLDPSIPSNLLIHKKINTIRGSSQRLVFLDCGEQSYASWTLTDTSKDWMEPIQSRHGDGSTFSFADGHGEHWGWTHINTKLIGKMSLYEFYYGLSGPPKTTVGWGCSSYNPGTEPNSDFLRIQKAIWAKSYQ